MTNSKLTWKFVVAVILGLLLVTSARPLSLLAQEPDSDPNSGEETSGGGTESENFLPIIIKDSEAQESPPGPEPQGPDSGSTEAKTAQVSAPVQMTPNWLPEPPTLTPEQQAQSEYWQERTHLPGRALAGPQPQNAGPVPGTESSLSAADVSSLTNLTDEELDSPAAVKAGLEPLAPSDALIYRQKVFHSVLPGGQSNIMESSVAQGGKSVFFTGNWFAARNTKGGNTPFWSYVSPYAGMSDFCCDQVTIYDGARDMHAWLRMGVPGLVGGNFENRFFLGISTDGAASFCTYSFTPLGTNSSWTNQWWDYPHIQLGADYMYISWNMFDWNGTSGTTLDDFLVRSVMLRFPMDSLATCSGFNYNYFTATDWETFVPVQGAWHKMYWASNWPDSLPQNNRLRIYKWDEDSTSVSWVTKTVAAWTFTNRGDAQCGSASGNWTGRLDQRVLTGARYEINGTNVMYPGRKILGWWWNVAQGGNFPQPYIEGAAFFEDTFDAGLTQVSGNQGRPLLWNSTTCFAYPSVTPNKRGDLGMIFHYGFGSAWNPYIGFSIADDYVAAPAGWTYFFVKPSSARPLTVNGNDRWGDYNTVREFEPTERAWVAGSHFINNNGNCDNCARPLYFVFGRERDFQSWWRWFKK